MSNLMITVFVELTRIQSKKRVLLDLRQLMSGSRKTVADI